MRYKFIVALFFLIAISLLWIVLFRLNESTVLDTILAPLYRQEDQEPVLNTKFAPVRKILFPSIVRFSTSEPTEVVEVKEVLTTLSSLFENLNYVGTIEADDVLAYSPLIPELSFIKERHPNKLEEMLMKWPLPKGNLTLSLLISTGPIRNPTLESLALYLPYISDHSARLAAANYCLGACASNSMPSSLSHCDILGSTLELSVVRELKRIWIPSTLTSILIASGLLHFAPAELDKALVDDIKKGLANLATTKYMHEFDIFLLYFIYYPTILRHPDTMQAIFERNALAFQAIPSVSNKQLTILSAVNKIKFGTSFVFTSMSKEEWIALFEGFTYAGGFMISLVFSIWAREDVSAAAWGQFAKDSSNTSMLSKLAFDLDGFFENCFDANLFKHERFIYFLNEFKYYPNSSKKQQFLTLLRAKLQGRPAVVQAVFWDDVGEPLRNKGPFRCLVEFFIDQDDKERLQALRDIISPEIDKAPSTALALNHCGIVRICQRLGGGVHGPLRRLAVRIGGAKVLDCLDFSQIQANDMGEMLRTLGISREQMNAALASLRDTAASGDELAEVLRDFHNNARHFSVETLTWCYALWFYLWKEHRAAFIEHVDPSIQQHYLPARPSP